MVNKVADKMVIKVYQLVNALSVFFLSESYASYQHYGKRH